MGKKQWLFVQSLFVSLKLNSDNYSIVGFGQKIVQELASSICSCRVAYIVLDLSVFAQHAVVAELIIPQHEFFYIISISWYICSWLSFLTPTYSISLSLTETPLYFKMWLFTLCPRSFFRVSRYTSELPLWRRLCLRFCFVSGVQPAFKWLILFSSSSPESWSSLSLLRVDVSDMWLRSKFGKLSSTLAWPSSSSSKLNCFRDWSAAALISNWPPPEPALSLLLI